MFKTPFADKISKGKGSFRVHRKDAFAFFPIFELLLFFIKKKRLRVKTLKDALAFTMRIIHCCFSVVNTFLQFYYKKLAF